MDKNIKTNDWFASRFLNKEVDAIGLLGSGITPENSSLQPMDFYKNKPKVQEYFKKDNGDFDEKSFKEFYDNISAEYLGLSSANSLDFIFNEYEKNPNIFNIKQGRTVKKNPIFSFVENPQDQTEGILGPNKWTDPKISKREAAQMNHYYDNETGEWSKNTLNEDGFWGVLTGKSLAYAKYDDDVYDESGNLIHQKGEWKRDEFGNFYAETVDNEESLDKEFVTLSEVLTDDNSAWNTIDIFDSDNIESNAWKSGVKTAAVIGSTFIPYVGAFIKYGTAALEFSKVLPQLTKMLNGLFNDESFDKLNKWDNTMKRFGKTKSDEATNNTFRLENLFDLIQESYMQLAQQRAISDIPKTLGLTKEAEKAAENAVMMQLFGAKASGLNIGEESVKAMAKASPIYKAALKDIEKYSKVSHAISMAYLIGTSGGDTFNMARGYGFDNFSSSVISLATLGAYGTLFQTDYFRSMLTGNVSQEEMKRVKSIVRQYLKNNGDEMTKDLAKATNNDAKVGFFKKWGKKISDSIVKHYDNAKYGNLGIVGGAINEGSEELVEEITADVAIQFGKGVNEIRKALTGQEYTNNYSYKDSSPLNRYLMALGGGAIGGAVFKLSDVLQANKSGYAAFKEMMGDQKLLEKEIITLISQDKKDLIYKALDSVANTEFANSNIDAVTGEVTDNYNNSQNAVLISLFKKGVESLDSFFNNNGVKMDYDDFGDIEISKGLRVAYLKDSIGQNGVHKSLFNDYIGRLEELSKLKSVKDNLAAEITDKNSEDVNAEKKKHISEIDKIIKLKLEEIKALINGEDDSYIGRLMLETNPDIMNGIIPTNKEALAKNLYGTNYDSLPKYLQNKVDDIHNKRIDSGETEFNYMAAWNLYKTLSSDKEIVNEFKTLLNSIDDRINMSTSEVSSGRRITKAVDFSKKDINDLYTEAYFYLEEIFGNKNALKRLYLGDEGDPNNDFELEYNYLSSRKDHILSTLLGIDNHFIIGLDEVVDDNPPQLLDIIISEFFNAENQNEYRAALIKKFNEFKSKDNINHGEKSFLDRYGSVENINLISFSNESFEGFGAPFMDDVNMWGVIDKIYSKVFGEEINISDIIDEENKKINALKDKYILSEEVSQIFDNIKTLIGDGGLAYSILFGSESTYNNSINGVPFGANNYINLSYKKSGNENELMELSKEDVNKLYNLFTSLTGIFENIIETSEKSKKNVINLHKKIGVKYLSARLKAIENFVSIVRSLNFQDDIISKFNNSFAEFDVDNSVYSDGENLSNEEFIKKSAELRNATINFENRWYNFYNSLDDAQKINFVSSIKKTYGASTVESDTSTVNSGTPEAELFLNSNLWSYLALRSISTTKAIESYKKYIEVTENCPFDTQEEIIIDILRYFNCNINDINIWFNSDDEDHNGYGNFYKLDSSGGIGKSRGIINAIKTVLDLENRGKYLKFAANTTEQLNVISSDSDDRFLIEQIQKMLNDDNKELFKEKLNNSYVIIDECSHLNTEELKKLNLWAKEFNVKIVLSGDTQQAGASDNFDSCFCLSSLRLDESLRSMTDIAIENNQVLGALFGSNKSSYFSKLPSNTLLKSYLGEDGLVGIRKDDLSLNLSLENIKNIITKNRIKQGSSILIFVEGDINPSLLSENLIDGYDILVTNKVSDVQGLEYDYVITNINTKIEFAGSDITEPVDRYKKIYTVLTRARNGVILPSDIDIKVNSYKAISKFGESQTKPVYNNIVNKDIIDNFVEYKKKVFELININSNINEDSSEGHIEVEKLPDINSPELQQIQVDTVDITYDLQDQTEFATSFITKNEANDSYAKALGFKSLEEMLKFRINAIESLYRGRVPENCKLVLAKYDGISTEGLYNLGNANKDNKNISAQESYLWLLLRTEKGDITLGMFQNLGLSQYGFEETKSNLMLMSILQDNDKYPVGWSTPISGKFSRVNNPLDISGNVKNSNISFKINNGDIQTPYSWMKVSHPFFFDPLGPITTVNMEGINKALKEIKSLYINIFSKLNLSNLSQEDFIILSELVKYEWNEGKKKYVFNAKGVPNLYHSIISFVDISNPNNADLTEMSNTYLKQLLMKHKQLSEILSILNNKPQKEALKDIKKVLDERDLWTVSVIVYDSKTIKDESRLRTILENLDNDKTSTRSRKGFNISIISQLGKVFADLCNIYNYKGSYNVKEGKYFTSSDKDKVVSFLNKHQESLIAGYNALYPDHKTDDFEDVLIWLSNFTFVPKDKNGRDFRGNHKKYQFQKDGLIFFKQIQDVIIDMYFGENKISDLFSKINSLSRSKFKGYLHLSQSLSGVLRSELLDDNEHVIYKNDDNVLANGSFDLESKVVQPATMRLFIKESNIFSPVESSQNNDNNIVEKSVAEGKNVVEDINIEGNDNDDSSQEIPQVEIINREQFESAINSIKSNALNKRDIKLLLKKFQGDFQKVYNAIVTGKSNDLVDDDLKLFNAVRNVLSDKIGNDGTIKIPCQS